MNGLQKPALAAMLRHELGGGTPAPYEPLFTSEWAFPIIAHGDESRTETPASACGRFPMISVPSSLSKFSIRQMVNWNPWYSAFTVRSVR